MQTAVSESVRKKRFSAGPGIGARNLLGLLVAVEINDLTMREFLDAFRTGLGGAQLMAPSPGWTRLKWVLASLEQIFQDCDDPARSVALEASHADQITLHFELMRSILHSKDSR